MLPGIPRRKTGARSPPIRTGGHTASFGHLKRVVLLAPKWRLIPHADGGAGMGDGAECGERQRRWEGMDVACDPYSMPSSGLASTDVQKVRRSINAA
jgi:hypothetical protein